MLLPMYLPFRAVCRHNMKSTKKEVNAAYLDLVRHAVSKGIRVRGYVLAFWYFHGGMQVGHVSSCVGLHKFRGFAELFHTNSRSCFIYGTYV